MYGVYDDKIFIESGAYEPREQSLYLKKCHIVLIIFYDDQYLILDWRNRKIKTFVFSEISKYEQLDHMVSRKLEEMTGYVHIKKFVSVDAVTSTRLYDPLMILNQEIRAFPYFVELEDLDQINGWRSEEDCVPLWIDLSTVRGEVFPANQIYMFERALTHREY